MSETPSDSQNLPIHFDHKQSEPEIYALWEKNKVFSASVDKNKKPYCVVIPPPNVTGILHMGHILDNTPQDLMTRWHKMRGFSAVWIPGTDHAGIATQNVVKKKLDAEGIDYRTLGREEFVKKVWDWKEKHGGIIINQLKRLGCSCDWEKERFTMDEGLSKAVLEAFVHLFNKGLIYKGKRMINWCPVCGTALANDEVDHNEQNGKIWHLKYPILDDKNNITEEFVIVATTRPETMLGDTAVAVNPNDERYKNLVGKNILLPLANRIIPIIADDYVDSEFGSGAVKITPAHDMNDYEMGKRHGLAEIVVIGLDAKMTNEAGKAYFGLDRYEARKKVIKDLEALGYFEKEEKHKNNLGSCYRCNTVVEPMVSDQWFVKMKPLAEKAKAVVVSGELEIIPESEKNDYFSWMDNIQDWCISRQLWWGHRIPVYYCKDCGHFEASVSPITKCSKCGSANIYQDEDVLDTWFSAQLWPFSTLGWPEKTPELDYWFPNTWLLSGRDILFFWDARMIMSALELTGKIPFKKLVLHGLVRDEQGRKLSKSLGNSPDPLDLFDQYGADGVRTSLMFSYPLGRQDTKLGEQGYKRGQSLIIKIWNATRLLLMNLKNQEIEVDLDKLQISNTEDQWILSRLAKTIKKHNDYLEKSNFTQSFNTLYHFFWDDFCDWYLEIIKERLQSANNAQVLAIAFFIQKNILKLFHPYIPFVTEKIWQQLVSLKLINKDYGEAELIINSNYPDYSVPNNYQSCETSIETMISLVKGIRDIRRELVIPPRELLELKVVCNDGRAKDNSLTYLHIAKKMGFLKEVTVLDSLDDFKGLLPSKFNEGIAYLSLPKDTDTEALIKRLEDKIKKYESLVTGLEKQLNNQDFIKRAPEELVVETKQKHQENSEAIVKFKEFISALN